MKKRRKYRRKKIVRTFMMMRTRGISGPRFGHHAGYSRLTHSVGNYYGQGGQFFNQTFELKFGWAGYSGCKTVLDNVFDNGWSGYSNCRVVENNLLKTGWSGYPNCEVVLDNAFLKGWAGSPNCGSVTDHIAFTAGDSFEWTTGDFAEWTIIV